MSSSVFAVGTTAAQIPLPAVPSVLVLNSSEGIGDKPNSATIVVNNSSACSLDPQQGIKLQPGQSIELPLRSPSFEIMLPLFAIASGTGATLTVALLFDDDDARF